MIQGGQIPDVATGARARSFPGLEPDGKLIWTYREAMVPPALPKSLLVIGSGATAVTLAPCRARIRCRSG